MIGKLVKKENYGWIVIYDEILGENIVKKNQNMLQLHPDNVNEILDQEKVFDNIEAKISAYPDIEFEIVENQKMSGVVKYAKIIQKEIRL